MDERKEAEREPPGREFRGELTSSHFAEQPGRDETDVRVRVGAWLASPAVSRTPSGLGALSCVLGSPCACDLGAGGAPK